MKCKTRKCKNERLCGGWLFCSDCLREDARKFIKNHPEAFKNTFPELFK